MLGGGESGEGAGAGLMVRPLAQAGSPRRMLIAGHSAVGPGSVGAVYTRASDAPRITAAAFVPGEDQAAAELLAGRRLLGV